MTVPTIVLNGDPNGIPTEDRLFASDVMLGQIYYRVLDGKDLDDILYGGYGIVSLTGGSGADRFVIGPTPGATGTTQFTAIIDYNRILGDRIVLSGGLTPDRVTVRAVADADLPNLNNLDDADRIVAAVGDAVIIDDQTGQALAVVKNTLPSDILFAGIDGLGLTPQESALLAPPPGGTVPIQDFAPFAPAFGPRIVEYADYDDRPSYYLSSAAYTTLAGARDSFNKFVSFDFTDPPAPYGTFLNGRVGPMQHIHNNELELFFVVSGTYVFTEGMQEGVNLGVVEDHVLTAGTLGYGPLGRIHGFRALPNDGPSRIFSIAIPGGLDNFFSNAGTPVSNRYNQIKKNSIEELANTTFWAGQRGDEIFLTPWDLGQINPATQDAWSELRPPTSDPSIAGLPIPTFAPQWPDMVTSSITSEDRPVSVGAFGENRLALVTEDEAKAVTGRVAWKGPFSLPSQPGASFEYDYLTLDAGLNADYALSASVEEAPQDPLDPTPSSFLLLYSLDGPLSVRLYDQFDPLNPTVPTDLTFELAPLTFVQLPTGTRYSLANTGTVEAKALSIHIFNQTPPETTQLGVASLDAASPDPDVLLLTGDPTFAAVDFTLQSRGKGFGYPLQIAAFVVDDQGNLICDCSDHDSGHESGHESDHQSGHESEHGEGPHTIALGDPEYVHEALKHSKVIMSVLDDNASQQLGASSTLTNFAGSRLSFLVVQGSTVADTLAAMADGHDVPPEQVRVGDEAASLIQNGDSVDIRFRVKGNRDVLVSAAPQAVTNPQDPLPLGLFNWNYAEQHNGFLDLTYDIDARSLNGQNVDVSVQDFASDRSGSRSSFGFYQILDEHGTILDPVTGNRIAPTAENRAQYLQAATQIAQATATGFLVNGAAGNGFATKLEGGFLYAPILMTGGPGQPNSALVPFAELNPGGALANVMIGTNTWAWEDGTGSRALYNDVRFGLNVMSPYVEQSMAAMA